tara:strand:+ start:87 stop:488 length:402 start_codon:yes stop_codon:yes gene_type:complete
MREQILARIAAMGLPSTCTFADLSEREARFFAVQAGRDTIQTIEGVDGEVFYYTVTVVPALDMGEVLRDTTTDEKIMYLNNSAPLSDPNGYWDCAIEEDTDPMREWDEFFYRFESLSDAENMIEFIRLSRESD